MKPPRDMEPYVSGERLRGDDFSPEEIQAWFAAEIEGYAEIVKARPGTYQYVWNALNRREGYRHLPAGRRFSHALGLGSFTGDEFLPVIDRIDRLTLLEPSDFPVCDAIGGVPATYVKPRMDGVMPFAADTFDLATCFGTLHHIPNVSQVLRELYRVMKPGGFALIREPAISMGDWTRPRPGLTRNERGLPFAWLTRTSREIGFQIRRSTACVFPAIGLIAHKLGGNAWHSPAWTAFDALVCRLTAWNLRYWRGAWYRKLAPSCLFFILQKPDPAPSP